MRHVMTKALQRLKNQCKVFGNIKKVQPSVVENREEMLRRKQRDPTDSLELGNSVNFVPVMQVKKFACKRLLTYVILIGLGVVAHSMYRVFFTIPELSDVRQPALNTVLQDSGGNGESNQKARVMDDLEINARNKVDDTFEEYRKKVENDNLKKAEMQDENLNEGDMENDIRNRNQFNQENMDERGQNMKRFNDFDDRNVDNDGFDNGDRLEDQESINMRNPDFANQLDHGNQQDAAFGDQDRAFENDDRGFGNQDGGFVNEQDRGFVNEQDRGFENEQDRGFVNEQDRGFVNEQDRGFVNEQDRGFVNEQDRGFGNEQDRGFGNEQDRGFGNQQFANVHDQGVGNQEDRGFRDEQGFGNPDLGFQDQRDLQNQGFQNQQNPGFHNQQEIDSRRQDFVNNEGNDQFGNQQQLNADQSVFGANEGNKPGGNQWQDSHLAGDGNQPQQPKFNDQDNVNIPNQQDGLQLNNNKDDRGDLNIIPPLPVVRNPPGNEGVKSDSRYIKLQNIKIDTYMRPLNQNNNQQQPNQEHFHEIPTLVSAAGDKDIQAVLQLVHSVQKFLPGEKIYIYDLGLRPEYKRTLLSLCGVRVKEFIGHAFPDFFHDFDNYHWRPLAIQSSLAEFGHVIWINPTSRLINTMKDLIEKSDRHGILLVGVEEPHSSNAVTDPGMLQYLPTNEKMFKVIAHVSMSAMILHNRPDTQVKLMRPWMACTMEKACLAPPGAKWKCHFDFTGMEHADCHRYDESALNIILKNLFNYKNNEFYTSKNGHFEHFDKDYNAQPKRCKNPDDLRHIN